MNTAEPAEEVFRTSDIDLAAYLKATGFSLRSVEPPEPGTYPRHANFVFEASQGLSDAVQAWENRHDEEILVDVAEFARARADFYRRAREEVRG